MSQVEKQLGFEAATVLPDPDTDLKSERVQTAQMRKAAVLGWTSVGVDPARMGLGPVPAVQKLLAKHGMTLEQVDLIELNEAFASQVIACDRELKMDPERLNVNGGGIALGHPTGCSGARILVGLVHELTRVKGRYGIATLCVSGGQGMAVLVERV